MPLFKNVIAHRIAPEWTPAHLEAFEAPLQRHCFQPCGPTQPLSGGWAPPRGEAHGAMVEVVCRRWSRPCPSCDVLPIAPLHTAISFPAAMARWLSSREAPAGFTVDRDLELKNPGEERSVVRYARHTLELDEIGQHIEEGKLPTPLALTWEGKVSFVLAELLAPGGEHVLWQPVEPAAELATMAA